MAIQLFGTPTMRHGEQLIFVCAQCQRKALSVNVVKGIYHCWVCGFGKGKPPLAGVAAKVALPPVDKALQLKILKRVIEISSLDELHRQYVLERGIVNPDKWGLITVPPQLRKLLPEFSDLDLTNSGLFLKFSKNLSPVEGLKWGRILVPFWSNNQIIGMKSRENPFDYSDGERLRYTAFRGSDVPSHFFSIKDTSRDLIVSEGEFKIMVGNDFGFVTGGFSGMCASFKAMIEYSQYVIRNKVSRIFVAFDNEMDQENNLALLTNTLRVTNAFKDKSAILWLPRDRKKGELDTFLTTYGEKELDRLIEDSWKSREFTKRDAERNLNRARIAIQGNQWSKSSGIQPSIHSNV